MDRQGVVAAVKLPLTAAVVGLLAICALLRGAHLYEELRYRSLLKHELGVFGHKVVVTNLHQYSSRLHALTTATQASVLAYVIAAIVFILWFRKAYDNIRSLGVAGLRYTPGWAVGSWFVPILNLARPARIMADIWRGSDPNGPRQVILAPQTTPASGLVVAWWTTYLACGALSVISEVMHLDATTLGALESAALAGAAADALYIAAAVLAIAVVVRVARNQTDRARMLATAPAALDWGHSLTTGPAAAAPARRTDVDELETAGGPVCPNCGFANHPLAISCLRCSAKVG